MVCHTVSPVVPVWVQIPGPQNRVRGEAKSPADGIPGYVRVLGQVTQFWQNILNLYYSTVFFLLFWHHQCTASGMLCQREVMSSRWRYWPLIRSTASYPLLRQLLLLMHSMTLTTGRRLKFKNICWGRYLHSPLTTCYQYAVDGKYCTLCVQIIWLLLGTNRHEAPWKPALSTSIFWSGSASRLLLPALQW